MIISMVIDILQTNLRQLGWAYYVFADRCRTDGWRCVVEQKYLTWQLNEQNKGELNGSQNAWDFSFTPDLEEIQRQIDVIPAQIFDKHYQKYGALAAYHLLTEPIPELEDYLNALFDGYQKDDQNKESIDAILIYPKAPFSVRKVAEERGIPLFVMEVGPMRWPLYLGSAYLSHYDQLSTDPGECEKLYKSFLNEWRRKKLRVLSREEILAIFLEKEYLPYLRYLNIPAQNEVLLIGNAVNGKADWPMNWDQTMCLADELRKRYGNGIHLRRDIREPYGASFGVPVEQFSQESPNIVSMLRSKRVACAGSNMLFEAMLWNRPVYCDTKDHGLYFICNHTDAWEDELAPIDFLNFFAFVYLVPMDIVTRDDYVRWRLTEPSAEELYNHHLSHYLSKWNLTIDDIYNGTKKDIVDRVTQARGMEESCFPREYLSDVDEAWAEFKQESNYDIGTIASQILAKKQEEEMCQQIRKEYDETQDHIARLENTKQELEQEQNQLIQEKQAIEEECAYLRTAKAQLEALQSDAEEKIVSLEMKCEETQNRSAELEKINTELYETKGRLSAQKEQAEETISELRIEIELMTKKAETLEAEKEILLTDKLVLEDEKKAWGNDKIMLESEISVLEEEKDMLKAELTSFFNSRSWRVTAPLRLIKNVFHFGHGKK